MPHRPQSRFGAPAPVVAALLVLSATPAPTAGAQAEPVGSADPTSGVSVTLSVIVPVEPYVLIVNRIAADRVGVLTLVPPGRSPHTYSPTPQQIAALAGADVLFRAGLELEHGLVPRLQELDEDLLVVDLMPADEESDDSHADRSGHDPHVWLGPGNIIGQATLIAETLTRMDPGGAEIYAAGLDSLVGDLRRLDAEIASRLAECAGSRFYVFHPAFSHFAEAYGLEQVAIETDGKEPSAKRLAGLVDMARADRARVIITQPQHSGATIGTLAREIGAEVVTIDPLAYDLFATARALADAVTQNAEIQQP